MASAATMNNVLTNARKLIGTPYRELDCSNFVHKAYAAAGMHYDRISSSEFVAKANKPGFCFKKIEMSEIQAGDVIAMPGHMGIWDPDGCTVLNNTAECTRMKGNMPFLSSRGNLKTGEGMGPEYARTEWWSGGKTAYRWIGCTK